MEAKTANLTEFRNFSCGRTDHRSSYHTRINNLMQISKQRWVRGLAQGHIDTLQEKIEIPTFRKTFFSDLSTLNVSVDVCNQFSKV